MHMRKKTYKATVICTVRVNVSDTWGEECTMTQIEKQATDAASGILDNLLTPSADNAMKAELHKTAIARVSKLRVISVEATAIKE